MLESEGIVEDVGVSDLWRGLTDHLQAGRLLEGSSQHVPERLVTHLFMVGLEAATAAKAATAENVAFIASDYTIERVYGKNGNC